VTIQDAWLAILPDTTHMTIMKRTDALLPMIVARIAPGDKN
jgi:hypothetical protein